MPARCAASTTVTVGPAALVSIAITPATGTVLSGESLDFSATGTYTDGSTQDLTSSVMWSSSDWNVATITTGGQATGEATGIATISAIVGSVIGTANLRVTPAVVVALKINPATLFMSPGSSLQIQAIATWSDGTTEDLSANVAWSVQKASIAIVSKTGIVTAQQIGSATITAQINKITASASLTVVPIVTVNILPATLSMVPGTTSQFHATATLSDGKTEDVTTQVAWSSTQPGIAGVSSGGVVTAKLLGPATILAQISGVTGSAAVTGVSPVALNIVPATLSMVLGSSRQLQAIATLSDGTTQDLTGIAAWSSTDPNIASVSSGGLVSAVQLGVTTILAQSNGLTGSAQITVVPLVAVSYFSRVNSVASGIDGTIRLANPDATSLCAMVYVFDQNQELNECCGCSVSGNGMRTLSLLNDLTANTLTGKNPQAGEIKVVPSDPAQNPQCDPSASAPTGVILAWGTNAQVPGAVTETEYARVPLSDGEESFLVNLCSFLKQLGGGHGICSCGSGE